MVILAQVSCHTESEPCQARSCQWTWKSSYYPTRLSPSFNFIQDASTSHCERCLCSIVAACGPLPRSSSHNLVLCLPWKNKAEGFRHRPSSQYQHDSDKRIRIHRV
ncbi:hypothetical protein VFPPC_18675 [Pochonia chlamydosporia 170]|uniref:Uncharacterized protein n=1 Tax=Pochonia chlamydosporia 170 TaxID=1380566 RepID=A0A219AS55_METCM|nr:hypothetical protein VFPPC_18675 [Pochonia chlamydosporia 170]OWT43598.1 hypothetical protein VFPPC_18675 [Pochonia chlamydosporia 170]